MGQEHHQPGLADPFRLPGADELINDTLSRIAKVPKLGLPQDQSIGVGHGEPELEAQHTVLRQGGVADGVGGLVGVQVGQCVISRHVLGLVMENVVSVGKGSTFNILTAEPDVDALLHQGAEGHGLGHCPVDGAVVDHVGTSLEDPHHGLVNDEVVGVGGSGAESFANMGQGLFVDSGVAHFQGIFAFEESRPGAVQPMFMVYLI